MNVVLFETNHESLYVALATTNIGPLNEFGDLILQCRSLLLNRPDFVVLHVRRPPNRVCS